MIAEERFCHQMSNTITFCFQGVLDFGIVDKGAHSRVMQRHESQ